MDLAERVRLKKMDRNELYTLEPPFPYTNFLIELSNVCNHRCIFCAHNKMKRKVGYIKRDILQKALQESYDLGTREVGMYSTGEPFLVKELPEYVKLAKDIGYKYVYLTSNGSMATPDKIRAVVDAGVDSIKFSINAPYKKEYAFIHGVDHFERVVENLKFLNEYRKESKKNYKIFITSILTRYTEDFRDDYFTIFKGLADEIVFKDVYNQGGYMPEIDTLLSCTYDKEKFRRCNLPFDSIYVTHEGYLSVCNADFENMLVVADLNKVSMKEGWYGEKMKEVRRAFIEDDLGTLLCHGCVHHQKLPVAPVTKEAATHNEDIFDSTHVEKRIEDFVNGKEAPRLCVLDNGTFRRGEDDARQGVV